MRETRKGEEDRREGRKEGGREREKEKQVHTSPSLVRRHLRHLRAQPHPIFLLLTLAGNPTASPAQCSASCGGKEHGEGGREVGRWGGGEGEREGVSVLS